MASNRKQRAHKKTASNTDPLTGEFLKYGTPRMVMSDFSYSRLPTDRIPVPRVLHRHESARINYFCEDYLGSPEFSKVFSRYIEHTKTVEELQQRYWYRIPYVVDILAAHAFPAGERVYDGEWNLDDLDTVLAWMRGETTQVHDVYRLTKKRITIIRYVRKHLLPFDKMPDSATA